MKAIGSNDIATVPRAIGAAATRVASSPPLRTSLVRRRRLVSRLIAGGDTRVVLIDAPAGFGKSTLLGEWEAADRRPFARLTLADHHDDPVLLTASIAAALAAVSPVDDEVYSAMHGSGPAALKVAIPRLLESLHRSQLPVVLALDDAHTLAEPESLAILAALADGLPQHCQLALASRTGPSIRLSRLRANRALTELGTADLAMSAGEAGRLLRACGLRLRADSISLLVRRTEGWPAALYLAALSLRAADDPDEAAARFAGDDRIVADYLRDEFISSLGADQLAFLTRTSILEQVSGELCDAILETEDSAEFLGRLARSNALVTAVDGKDSVFRYHALLREMLGSELHRLHAREEAELHGRASTWYAQRGDHDRSVPHAISAGDLGAAATLIWSLAADYASAGRVATLERWLETFTRPELEASAPLCLVRATCAMSAGNGSEVSHWTSRALELIERTPQADGEQLRVAAGAIRAAGAAHDGVVQMRSDAVAAFELMPDPNPWRSLCRLVEGAALHLERQPELARAALEDGARRAAVGVPSIHGLCLAQLALLSLDEGDAEEAARLAMQSLATSEANALADQPTTALVFAVAALTEARRGDSASASDHAKRAKRLLAELTEISSWYEAETRIVIARALARLDDVAGARAQLADAGRRMRETPDAPVLREWLEQAWREADSATANGRWPLSPAELRLLHYLPTHMTFREIAEDSFVSTNTVKTQARSIYRKLGVSSRAEAVACARAAGLVGAEAAVPPPQP